MLKRTVWGLVALVLALTVPAVAEEPEKVIYLTFDDGPGPYTAQLLDILQKNDAKGTFFLVNTGVDMDHLLCRMVQEGHSIGIHSYCHDFRKIYADEQACMEDIYAMQRLIYEKTGIQTNLLRFPGGSSNTVSKKYCPGLMSRLVKRVTEEGFSYFDWNVDSGDGYGCDDPDLIFRKVTAGIAGKNRAVVLQHDVNGCSVQVVERIIRWGKARGYVFRPLTEETPCCHHRIQN